MGAATNTVQGLKWNHSKSPPAVESATCRGVPEPWLWSMGRAPLAQVRRAHLASRLFRQALKQDEGRVADDLSHAVEVPHLPGAGLSRPRPRRRTACEPGPEAAGPSTSQVPLTPAADIVKLYPARLQGAFAFRKAPDGRRPLDGPATRDCSACGLEGCCASRRPACIQQQSRQFKLSSVARRVILALTAAPATTAAATAAAATATTTATFLCDSSGVMRCRQAHVFCF